MTTFAMSRGTRRTSIALYETAGDIQPLRTLGLSTDQVLHVAGSATDVIGTKAAGLRCVWVNRQHDRVLDERHTADDEREDLRGLLTLVSAAAP